MEQLNFIILGPQGSGKGTQAKLLADKYSLDRIETGELLRDIAREDSDIGRKIDELINKKGELAPFKIILDLVENKIKSLDGRGVILDGAPRTLDQAKDIETLFEKFGRAINKVIYLKIPKEETIERLSKRRTCRKCNNPLILGVDIKDDNEKCSFCGGEVYQRQDDTPEKIKHRLEIYNKETLPVVEYFQEKNILFEVDGIGNIEEVFGRIISKL